MIKKYYYRYVWVLGKQGGWHPNAIRVDKVLEGKRCEGLTSPLLLDKLLTLLSIFLWINRA